MKFKVLMGSHIENKREYPKGSIIDSPFDLTKIFVNKFARVDNEQFTENVAPIPIKGVTLPREFRDDPALTVMERPTKTAAKPNGKDVTKGFPTAIEQDCKVFRDGEEFFVYDADNLTKPINSQGADRAGVARVIQKAFG